MAKKRSTIWYTVGAEDTCLITRVAAVIFRALFDDMRNPEKNARSSAVLHAHSLKNARSNAVLPVKLHYCERF